MERGTRADDSNYYSISCESEWYIKRLYTIPDEFEEHYPKITSKKREKRHRVPLTFVYFLF